MQSTPRLRLDSPLSTLFPIFSISGATPEGEPDPASTDGSTGSGGSATDADAKASSAGGGEDSTTRDPEARVAALKAEKDRHFTRAQEAERERDDLRAKVDAAERKDRTELENATKDLEAAKTSVTQLQTTNRGLALENAFLKANETTWHDPSDALTLADLSEVKVGDDGKVTNPDALKKAITDLAKRKPHLVKTADEPTSKDKPTPRTSGEPPKAPPNPNGQTPTDEALKRKFPALRSH